MLKKVLAAALLLASVLALLGYFSPHWTVYRMRSAAEDRDYAALSSYVDFPALRGSFKGQIRAALDEMLKRETGNGDANGNSIAALGQGLIAGLTGPAIDALVTPAGIIEMINAGEPRINRAVITSAITRVPAVAGPAPEMEVSYRGWNQAAFRRAGAPGGTGSFVLARHGLWRWKLAAVELGK